MKTNSSPAYSVCAVPVSFRKEVIQPQVLLQLPCYDFTPIADHTIDSCLPKVSPPASGTADFRDVTGGVYKPGNVFTPAC